MTERQETDAYLTDFSKAWGNVSHVESVADSRFPGGYSHANAGVRDHIPQWLDEEYRHYQEQQKATTTVVDFGEGVTVHYGDQSDRIGISTGRGYAEFPRDLAGAIGRLLVSLNQPEGPAFPGAPSHAPGDNIPKGIDPVTWNCKTAAEKANFRRNMDGLEYALEQDRKRNRR